jgi:predicted transposase YbfD/YdcC
LSGATTWVDIADCGRAKEQWIKRVLPLKNGIPSHDTFRRVFGLIESKQLMSASVRFIMNFFNRFKKVMKINDDESYRLINIDGKEQKGTGRKYDTSEEIRNLQTLHVYDSSHGIVLASEMIDSKTNEIPVGQEILSTFNLKNSIVTCDALNTQKKLTQIVIKQKGDYVFALKGNSGLFHTSVNDTITPKFLENIRTKGIDYYSTTENAHNQQEIREFYMISSNKFVILEKEEWNTLRNIICYQKTMIKNGTPTIETRYYITSLNDVTLCAEAIRGHWSIENQLHWFLDTVFYEDMNKTMDKDAYNNFSILNKMALSILKLAKPLFKSGMTTVKKCFGWNSTDTLSKILNYLTSDQLLEAMSGVVDKIEQGKNDQI